MRHFRRTGPLIGQPLDEAEARALRDELFVEEWSPVFDRVGFWLGALAACSSFLLLATMIIRVAIVVYQHAHGAVS